jgi:hypothetical protein
MSERNLILNIISEMRASQQVTGLSEQQPGFEPGSVHMGSMGDKMEIREGSLKITAVFTSHYNSPQSTTFKSIFKVNFS